MNLDFLDKIYSVVIYRDGEFCFDVYVRDKTLDDYRLNDRVYFCAAMAIVAVAVAKALF